MNKHNRYRSGFTLIEGMVVGIIVFIALAMLIGGCRGMLKTSDGKRIGTLTKLSHSGAFIKSYEGELNLGGVRKHTDGEGRSTMVANVWRFSVSDPDMASTLENMIGQDVVIKYREQFVMFDRDTRYDVVSVELYRPDDTQNNRGPP